MAARPAAGGVVSGLGARLRQEADRARSAPQGRHPQVPVLTHAAALRFAADLADELLAEYEAQHCTLPTYLSWAVDGDDGPWVERAECDGPRPCGWSRDLSSAPHPEAGGINSDEFAALHTDHHTGMPA